MKHHFADLLDRSGGYWTITPNAERWSCHYSDVADAPVDTTRLTLTRSDSNWKRALGLAQLVELTLHEPDQAQLEALADFRGLTVLRISHARPKTLAMIVGLSQLRELVLEYVSGVSCLSPLGQLPALQALHMENLRRVSDFSGLAGSRSLRHVAIVGTPDWKQPVDDFGFLGTIPTLESLELCWVKAPSASPVLASLLALERLAKLEIAMGDLPLEEFAWLQARLPHVAGAVRSAFVHSAGQLHAISDEDVRAAMPMDEFLRHPGLQVGEDGRRYEWIADQALLLGKGQRFVSGEAGKVLARCRQHEVQFLALVEQLRDGS